jgi:peptide/nickel transport system substrate-binding protein
MDINYRRLDDLRRGRGPIQEHVIDEFVAGRLTRRDFLRRGSAAGLSLPLLGAILAACGSSKAPGAKPASSSGKSGATITVGVVTPTAAINPITIADQGGIECLDQVGEFLVFTDHHLKYHPWLAESWQPNSDATVWTFKIRQGVKFNTGRPMTVDDVVYSFKSQSNPKSSANALSIFGGTLTPDGVVKVDDTTVAFHLEQPNGGFIDAVSNDNYNMIIVPNGYDFGDYQKSFIGTGRFMKTSYSPGTGATFARNPHYWGTAAKPAKLEFIFYAGPSAMTSALQAGQIDTNDGFSIAESPQLLSGFNVISLKASYHRELSMRTDIHPFTSKYVRQAIAYTLDRPAIVQALFKGYAQVGNDTPFAPVFPATVGPPAIPQRQKNLKLARELLAKGGVPNGFSTPLLTEMLGEIPHFAQVVKQSAAQIGVDINLTIETSSKYYGQAVFGKSDWLDGEMSLVDYGARAVPNIYLEAPLQSINAKTGQGSWNAAHFNNSAYDKLSKEYVATPDLSTQRRLAGQIERLLLDETPIIYAYFYDWLTATQKNVTGVYPAITGLFLWNAAKT